MPTAITIITTTNKPVMMLETDSDPLVMLVALSTPDLNTGIYMLCQCNPWPSTVHVKYKLSHSSHTCWLFMPWWDVTQFPHLTGTGRRRLWQEEEGCGGSESWRPQLLGSLYERHKHPWWSWEAFSEDTNTHDKLQRLGKYSFWICIKQSNNLIWTSAASSCTSSSANHR